MDNALPWAKATSEIVRLLESQGPAGTSISVIQSRVNARLGDTFGPKGLYSVLLMMQEQGVIVWDGKADGGAGCYYLHSYDPGRTRDTEWMTFVKSGT